MKLTETEKNSDLWRKIRGYMEQRLADHRRMNDADLDAESTAKLRGRIAELNKLLQVDQAEPRFEVEEKS